MRTALAVCFALAVLLACSACETSRSSNGSTVPPNESNSLRVLVVDGATREPVEGAVVQFMKGTEWLPTNDAEQHLFVFDREAYRRRHVSSARTGADGVVELVDAVVEKDLHRRVPNIVRIDATHAGKWGVLDLSTARDGTARIELAPDSSRRFLVRAAGVPVPAGVRIGVWASSPEDEVTVWVAETDEHGAALLPHLAYYRGFVPEGAQTFLTVARYDDQDSSDQRPFELESGDDLVLDLPDLSHLELDVVDGSGRAIENGRVEIVFAKDLASADWDDPWERPIVDGRSTLAAFRSGRTIVVRVGATGWCDELVALDTPALAGATAKVRVTMQRRSVVVTGRLLDASREPWAGASVDLVDANTHASVLTSTSELVEEPGADGRFRLEADPELLRAAKGELLVDVGFELSESGGVRAWSGMELPRNQARVSISLEFGDSSVRLGDFAMARE